MRIYGSDFAFMDIPFFAPRDYRFPDPAPALEYNEGLVGVSADLDSGRLLAAYRAGIFPWFSEGGLFYWFCTAPRTVLRPETLHIGRSLAKLLRNKSYLVTANHSFEHIIAACAAIPRAGQDGTWIALEFQQAYTALHRAGYAHSFECWYPAEQGEDYQLAGGFYGVQIGRVFYGESMFALQPDASKIAFASAVPYLADCGIALIDCQQDTQHLARFGSQQMALADFQAELGRLNPLPLNREIGRVVIARAG